MMRDFSAIFNNSYFSQSINFDDGSSKVCIIQQATDDDLKILPEGDRYNPTLRVMSQEKLTLKETFHWQGFKYRIITDAIWNHYGYYDSLATRYDGSQSNSGGGFTVT